MRRFPFGIFIIVAMTMAVAVCATYSLITVTAVSQLDPFHEPARIGPAGYRALAVHDYPVMPHACAKPLPSREPSATGTAAGPRCQPAANLFRGAAIGATLTGVIAMPLQSYEKPVQTPAQRAKANAATAARKARDAADAAGIAAIVVDQPAGLPRGFLSAPDALGRVQRVESEQLRRYCLSKAGAAGDGLVYAGTAADLPRAGYQLLETLIAFPDLNKVQVDSILAGCRAATALGLGSDHRLPYPAQDKSGAQAWAVAAADGGLAFSSTVKADELPACFAEMLQANHNRAAYRYTGA